jgi:glycosyltransferase involved in cell wall biosynthesis
LNLRPGFVVPVYRHGKTAGPLAEKLSAMGLPVILVDDGNEEETRSLLAEAAASTAAVLVRLEKNRGKGGAIRAGIEKAHEMGLTHLLQIDADGQHDISRAAFFLEQSRLHPEVAICSYPEYDDSVPVSRKKGRQVANTWARILTFSGDIVDALCGFRVYPVEVLWNIMSRHYLDSRMGFDAEILVRLHWKRIPLLFFPIKVVYPQDGISNFHMVRDNVRLSLVFSRLFLGMLVRLPILIWRRLVSSAGRRHPYHRRVERKGEPSCHS